MPYDEDLPKRIEAVFERTGLGNADPEKVSDFVEAYEHAMATADRIRNRKGRNFEEILSSVSETPGDEEA